MILLKGFYGSKSKIEAGFLPGSILSSAPQPHERRAGLLSIRIVACDEDFITILYVSHIAAIPLRENVKMEATVLNTCLGR